jgi:UDP-GlcNAc:undecaprenyl-phosphate/decaprenyl-phosphate GlcNAc-1-phosphate transferase
MDTFITCKAFVMIEALIAAGAVAFVISLFGTYAMRRISPRLGLIDVPGERKVHSHPMPKGGGLAIFAGIWLTVGFALLGVLAAKVGWLPLPDSLQQHVAGVITRVPPLAWIFGGAVVIAVTGIVDDRRGLSPWTRLAIEFAVAACLVILGKQVITIFITNDYVSTLITILWIVGITNTFNLLDNMDGLSAGVAFIVSAMLMVVALQTGQFFLATLCVVIMGSTGGFLVLNFPPASIFMGDCGSTLLGYMLAVTTVNFTFYVPGHPLFPAVVPLLIMAVPLFDTISVVVIRLEQGRSPFEGDKNHFSHRLVAMGMTPRLAVVTIYLLAAAMGLGATIIYHASTAGTIIILIQTAVVFAVIALLERTGRMKQ